MKTFLSIDAPHFNAGVVVGERAAPIIAYMKDWSEEKIRNYCKKKNWTITPINTIVPLGTNKKEEKVYDMAKHENVVREETFDGTEIPEFLKRDAADGETVAVQTTKDFGSSEIDGDNKEVKVETVTDVTVH